VAKRVLDVGQCQPDHLAIRNFITERFDATVHQSHGLQDTLAALHSECFDLVLINRKLDRDYSDGIEVLKAIKAEEQLTAVPVMLVTNYQEHQQTAVAAGGVPGFGKNEFHEPHTLERLAHYLG